MDISRLRIRAAATALLASCLVGCKAGDAVDELRDADLVFVRGAGSSMDMAIAAATSDDADAGFVHVAIVEIEAVSHDIYILESTPENGVTRRPLAEFTAKNGADRLVFKRLDDLLIEEMARQQSAEPAMVLYEFVLAAKSHLGEPYDFSYMPDNGSCYCSELVYDCYVDQSAMPPGDPHLFQAKPMNFLDADGNLPEFWAGLFSETEVPQGVMGTNPQDLSQSKLLKTINPEI